jgi:N-acetylmuramoyl-L-alanine amidase
MFQGDTMKKLIAVPVVAVIAAAGAASAAGFAGGVSAGALQTGKTNDLECAASARVIEWGFNDHLNTPNVDTALVKLTDAECVGQSVTVLPLKADGTQYGPRAQAKVPAQASGPQTVRVVFDTPMPAEQLTSVRISVDPGHGGIATGSIS